MTPRFRFDSVAAMEPITGKDAVDYLLNTGVGVSGIDSASVGVSIAVSVGVSVGVSTGASVSVAVAVGVAVGMGVGVEVNGGRGPGAS